MGDSPAVLGRYALTAQAPKGLRAVLKLGEIDRAMASAREFRETYARLDAAEHALVEQLRGRGASWDSIGWVLGVTGEAVRQRFGNEDGGVKKRVDPVV